MTAWMRNAPRPFATGGEDCGGWEILNIALYLSNSKAAFCAAFAGIGSISNISRNAVYLTSSSSFVGSGGKGLCGSVWYQ